MKKLGKTFVGGATALLIATAMAFFTGCAKVDTGDTGLFVTWGKADREALEPGLHFLNPFTSRIERYSIREQKQEIKTASYTKDMQSAELQILIVYSITKESVYELHSKYGHDYPVKTVLPAVFGATKDVLGQWEADKLVNGREKATEEITVKARELLKGTPVNLVSVVILNIDYSDAFEKAIEAKQIATQEAIKARNRTVQIEEEARQNVIKAKAEADAKIALAEADAKAVEIIGQALDKNPDVVKIKFVEKWDGKAPQTLILGSEQGLMVSAPPNIPNK